MRQAIETKYIGPTNRLSGRIVARAWAGRKVYPYRHDLSIEDNHKAAAKAFAEAKGWGGFWYGGGAAKGDGFVFVNVEYRPIGTDGFVVHADTGEGDAAQQLS